MKSPDAEELLAIVRQYFRFEHGYDLVIGSTPEHDRWSRLRFQMFQSTTPRWRQTVVREVTRALPALSVTDPSGPDASFMVEAYQPRQYKGRELRYAVLGSMSHLAPVYTVYAVHEHWLDGERLSTEVFYEVPDHLREPAEVIGRAIENEFKVARLPVEVAQTRIPLFVDPHEPGEATLFHALFSAEPGNLP